MFAHLGLLCVVVVWVGVTNEHTQKPLPHPHAAQQAKEKQPGRATCTAQLARHPPCNSHPPKPPHTLNDILSAAL